MWWVGSHCTRFLGEECEREAGACGDCEKVNRVGIEKEMRRWDLEGAEGGLETH